MYFYKLKIKQKLYIIKKFYSFSSIEIFSKKWFWEFDEDFPLELEEIARKYIEKKMPLSKIFGEKRFWKSCFKTNEYTLDPRPETELIIEILLKKHSKEKNLSFLELGTGSGAIIISILQEFYNSSALGIDICPKTLNVAAYNKQQLLNKNNRLILKQNDWLYDINDHYDILISNPPYLSKKEIEEHAELQYDPFISLYAENLEKYYSIWEKRNLFKEIYLEINPKDSKELQNLFKGQIHKDNLGLDRIISWIQN